MSKFEDHLWREFVREHGDPLTQMSRPTATHTRRARPTLVVGTGLGLAGAGGLVALPPRRDDHLAGVRGDPQPRRHVHHLDPPVQRHRRREREAAPGRGQGPGDAAAAGGLAMHDHGRPARTRSPGTVAGRAPLTERRRGADVLDRGSPLDDRSAQGSGRPDPGAHPAPGAPWRQQWQQWQQRRRRPGLWVTCGTEGPGNGGPPPRPLSGNSGASGNS